MGGNAPALAAKAASTTIPIVFAVDADPVKIGLVSSSNRPGGNVTGVTFLLNMIVAKLFEVLHETVSNAAAIGFLVNPTNPRASARLFAGDLPEARSLHDRAIAVYREL